MSPLDEHRVEPWDEPRRTEEEPSTLRWNRIGCAVFLPIFFGGWVWSGIQGAAQEAASTGAADDAAGLGVSVIVIGAAVLLIVLALSAIVRLVGSRLP